MDQNPSAYILPLSSPDLNLQNAGGKGANLARLARAGLPVPPGFVITTQAYQSYVASEGIEEKIAQRINGLRAEETGRLEAASKEIRAWFRANPIKAELASALHNAYRLLGQPPVAVRSSATAEDLPEMSFAGQQDTFLNVLGEDALLTAVVDCWSSLWTARAIGYRLRNRIPQRDLALAVVVQEMVQSDVSGVLFTANPVTGLRSEIVIDATFGLGEALVSGQVEPDHYIVRKAGDEPRITSKILGAKALAIQPRPGGGTNTVQAQAGDTQALPDDQILALAELGWRVAAVYGAPQDIEWAWAEERLCLLQSRPVTSLYPLPVSMPPEPLQVLFSFGAAQGILDPMTPYGMEAICSIGVSVAQFLGYAATLETQKVFRIAGERLYINITPIVRNRIGRKVVVGFLGAAEPGAQQALQTLLDEPRLSPGKGLLRPQTAVRLLRLIVPTVARMLATLLRPNHTRERVFQAVEELYAGFETAGKRANTLARQLDFVNRVFNQLPPLMIRRLIPAFAPSVVMLTALKRLASGVPRGPQLALEVTRGLPHNVTTEMDLALWETARLIRQDVSGAAYFSTHSASELACDYLAGRLPPRVQDAIRRFLDRYGMRGTGEIDIGRPRWREDPTPVMQALTSYLNIEEGQNAPDEVFRRGAKEAQAAVETLVLAVRQEKGGWIKARQVRWAASRVRALSGLRELPKFLAVRTMGIIRGRLLQSGQSLAAWGVLKQADDIFYLKFSELQQAANWQTEEGHWDTAGDSPLPELAGLVAQRRQRYEREMLRRQVPRLLLSDGRAFYEGVSTPGATGENVLVGSPVSPGMVEGPVRVVFNPHEAQLQPGEILVCPGTDPAWTPLFLAAGGLVMEVGGWMTHGSVVAREYGIPAVVGVHQATQRLKTGQRIRLDGSSGQIFLLEPSV